MIARSSSHVSCFINSSICIECTVRFNLHLFHLCICTLYVAQCDSIFGLGLGLGTGLLSEAWDVDLLQKIRSIRINPLVDFIRTTY